jgi:hypothetical protein
MMFAIVLILKGGFFERRMGIVNNNRMNDHI